MDQARTADVKGQCPLTRSPYVVRCTARPTAVWENSLDGRCGTFNSRFPTLCHLGSGYVFSLNWKTDIKVLVRYDIMSSLQHFHVSIQRERERERERDRERERERERERGDWIYETHNTLSESIFDVFWFYSKGENYSML